MEERNTIPDHSQSKPHVLYNTTRVGFGFIDRLRVLFGQKLLLKIDIKVSKEVIVLQTTCDTSFEPLIKHKSKSDKLQSQP